MSCFHILGILVNWKDITVTDLCMLLRDVHFRKSCTISQGAYVIPWAFLEENKPPI